MVNMKTAGAVSVNSYSATVRWLVNPERTLLLAIARINTRAGFAARIKLVILFSSYCSILLVITLAKNH